MGDQLVDLLKGAGIEEEIDSFAGGELAGLVLTAQTIVATAAFGEALEIGEALERIQCYTFAACAFSQSLRNFSSPMSVSGCFRHASMTAAGPVHTPPP